MPREPRPPPPGPFVSPNFLPVVEALGSLPFPISKRDLLDHVAGSTVILQGRNVDLRELLQEIHDDSFDSEEELLDALEALHTRADDSEPPEGRGPEG